MRERSRKTFGGSKKKGEIDELRERKRKIDERAGGDEKV